MPKFRESRLSGMPLDTLIENALALLINEPSDEARRQLQALRLKLARGLAAVDDRLGRLGECGGIVSH